MNGPSNLAVKGSSPILFPIWNVTLLFSTAAVLFFLFTTGVPLVEWHLLPATASKAVFNRMTQIAILTEAILLALLYFLQRGLFSKLWIVRSAKTLAYRVPLKLQLVILSSSYSSLIFAANLMRHFRGQTGADLAIFVQAVWNSTQGRFLYSSIKGMCILGDHFSPILALIVPFYALCSHPPVLLFFQAFSLGACVYLVGIFAKDQLKDNGYALLFALMFFFYHKARAMATVEDFHPEVMVEPVMMMAFLFLLRDKAWAFLLSLLVLISAKENMLGISFALGIYALAFREGKWRWIGLSVALFSAAFFLFEIKWLIPHFHQGAPYQYTYYKDLIHAFFTPRRLSQAVSYIFGLYMPFCFLPFFHFPTLWLTFPILFQNILSSGETMRNFSYHYTTGLHGFVFIATIFGLRSLTERYAWLAKRRTLLMAVLFVVAMARSGVSEYFYFWSAKKLKPPYSEEVVQRLKAIPENASVLANIEYTWGLIHRKELIFLDLITPPDRDTLQKHPFDYVILDKSKWHVPQMTAAQALDSLKEQGYVLEFRKDSFYIFRKNSFRPGRSLPEVSLR